MERLVGGCWWGNGILLGPEGTNPLCASWAGLCWPGVRGVGLGLLSSWSCCLPYRILLLRVVVVGLLVVGVGAGGVVV